MKSNPKKHVVQIIIALGVGGVQKLALGLATSPVLSEYKQSVVCLLGVYGGLLDEYQEAGIGLFSCRIDGPRWLKRLPRFIRDWLKRIFTKTFPYRLALLLKIIGADVVHLHIPRRVDLISQSVIQICKLPLIWSIHGENIGYNHPKSYRYDITNEYFLSSKRSRITADSTYLARQYVRHYPEMEKVVTVVHAGANTRQFNVVKLKDVAWRKQFGIPPNAVLFGSCGRLSHIKGFDIFIEAAAGLIRDGFDAYFAISGTGKCFDQLSAQITDLGLNDRFYLLGFQEDLAFIHKQFDVFVLSSRSEGFPLTLIEALTSGLPCIAANVSGVEDMLENDGGVIVDVESPGALLAGMKKMMDLYTREKYAANANLIGNKYSFEASAEAFTDIYFGYEKSV